MIVKGKQLRIYKPIPSIQANIFTNMVVQIPHHYQLHIEIFNLMFIKFFTQKIILF